MDEETSSLVAKAAATFSRDKFLRPLRALCVRKITSSLKFYVDKGVTSLHQYLLPNLCQEVFDEFLGEMQYKKWHKSFVEDVDFLLYKQFSHLDLLKIASLFVNPALKSFDTTVIKSELEASDVEERRLFFKKLAEGAPNLASFEHQFQYNRAEASLLASDYFSLGQMSQLVSLKIEFKSGMTNADLKVIGKSLPLLRRLDIWLNNEVTVRRGMKHLKRLKMLEHLLLSFNDFPRDYMRQKFKDRFIEFCLLKMPHLKIAGYDLATDHFKNVEDSSHVFFAFNKMSNPPLELALEHLQLRADFPPAHVTHLRVSCKEDVEFCLGRTFPKLKKLFISEVPFKHVLRLLKHFGHLLSTLGLSCIREPCDLLEIFNLCPHLEDLLIEFSSVQDLGFINPSFGTKVAKMKRISLETNCFKADGLLMLLMACCPDLEELFLEVSIPESEVEQVAAGIAAGAFLCAPKLKDVQVLNLPSVPQGVMENFVNQVVAHCPKLSLIKVSQGCTLDKFGPLIATLLKFGKSHVIRV